METFPKTSKLSRRRKTKVEAEEAVDDLEKSQEEKRDTSESGPVLPGLESFEPTDDEVVTSTPIDALTSTASTALIEHASTLESSVGEPMVQENPELNEAKSKKLQPCPKSVKEKKTMTKPKRKSSNRGFTDMDSDMEFDFQEQEIVPMTKKRQRLSMDEKKFQRDLEEALKMSALESGTETPDDDSSATDPEIAKPKKKNRSKMSISAQDKTKAATNPSAVLVSSNKSKEKQVEKNGRVPKIENEKGDGPINTRAEDKKENHVQQEPVKSFVALANTQTKPIAGKKGPIWNAPRFVNKNVSSGSVPSTVSPRTGIIRVGLSRNFKVRNPLHSNVKLSD